jgi:aspartyl protease family protein
MNETDSPQRLGKGMLTVGWLIGLALLTVFFARWESARINPNQNPEGQLINGVREVTLKENVQNHYVASGAINGQDVTFLLDTGATDVVVPAALAKKLHLEPGARGQAMTANGIVQVHYTRIDELALGNIRLHNVRASINPGMQGDEVLLGMSALRQVDFSQKDGQLILRQD